MKSLNTLHINAWKRALTNCKTALLTTTASCMFLLSTAIDPSYLHWSLIKRERKHTQIRKSRWIWIKRAADVYFTTSISHASYSFYLIYLYIFCSLAVRLHGMKNRNGSSYLNDARWAKSIQSTARYFKNDPWFPWHNATNRIDIINIKWKNYTIERVS